MQMHPQYAQMIMKGAPDFIEVKSYMHVGSSRENLQRENMPLHEEVVGFCQELVKFLPDYEIVSEHIPSRVVMFAHKRYKVNGVWHTWIDFEKWHELVNSEKEFTSHDYWKRTPQTGLSGKGTKDHFKEVEKRSMRVDEKTPELSFYNQRP